MQNNFFQQMTISAANNKKALELSKSNPDKLLEFISSVSLSDKSYEKIATQSIGLGYTKKFLNTITDKDKRNKLLFNLFLDNNEKLLDLYTAQELIEFLNITNVLGQTNLHSIISVSDKNFSSKLLNKIVAQKDKLIFTQPDNSHNILHTCLYKGVEEIEQFFESIDKKLFTAQYKYSLPIYYTRNISVEFFEKICTFYKQNNLNIYSPPNHINGRSLLKSLIHEKSLDKVKVLYKHFPDYLYNNEQKRESNDYHFSFSSGTADISQYILEKQNYLKTPLNTNHEDILWLSCRYYQTHKEIFNRLMQVEINLADAVEIKNKSVALEIEEFDFENDSNKGNKFLATKDLEASSEVTFMNAKRNYTTLLAEYADIEAIESFKNKGLLDLSDPEAIYEAIFKDRVNYVEKIDYFTNLLPITHTHEFDIFKRQKISTTSIWIKKPFILNIVENSSKHNCIEQIKFFEQKYNIQFNDFDYCMAMFYSIKESHDKLFQYCKEKISLDSMISFFDNVQQHQDKDPLFQGVYKRHLLLAINSLNKNFIKNNTEDMVNLIDKMLLKNLTSANLQKNLISKPKFLEALINANPENKSHILSFFDHVNTNIEQKIKSIEKIPETIKKDVVQRYSASDLLRGNINNLIDYFDLEKQKNLFSILYQYHKEGESEKEHIVKNIEKLLDRKYKDISMNILNYKQLDKNLLRKIICSYIEQIDTKEAPNNEEIFGYEPSYYNQKDYFHAIAPLFDKFKSLDLDNYLKNYMKYIETNNCSINTNKDIMKSILKFFKISDNILTMLYEFNQSSFLFVEETLFNIQKNEQNKYNGFNKINKKIMEKGPEFIREEIKKFNCELHSEDIDNMIIKSLCNLLISDTSVYYRIFPKIVSDTKLFPKVVNHEDIILSYLKFIGVNEIKDACLSQSDDNCLTHMIDNLYKDLNKFDRIRKLMDDYSSEEKIAYIDKYILNRNIQPQGVRKKFKI